MFRHKVPITRTRKCFTGKNRKILRVLCNCGKLYDILDEDNPFNCCDYYPSYILSVGKLGKIQRYSYISLMLRHTKVRIVLKNAWQK